MTILSKAPLPPSVAWTKSVLSIQDPPGTGKTHVTARSILLLVKAGYRVGVASNSHEAIRNVLMRCLKAFENERFKQDPDIMHKVSTGEDGYPDDCEVWLRLPRECNPHVGLSLRAFNLSITSSKSASWSISEYFNVLLGFTDVLDPIGARANASLTA